MLVTTFVHFTNESTKIHELVKHDKQWVINPISFHRGDRVISGWDWEER